MKASQPPVPAPGNGAQKEAAGTLYRLGLRALIVGENAKAVSLLQQAIQERPTFAAAYRGLGLAYQKMGRKGSAKAAFLTYLKLNPGATDTKVIRGRLLKL